MEICVATKRNVNGLVSISISKKCVERLETFVNDCQRILNNNQASSDHDMDCVLEKVNLFHYKVANYCLALYDIGALSFSNFVDLECHFKDRITTIYEEWLEQQYY